MTGTKFLPKYRDMWEKSYYYWGKLVKKNAFVQPADTQNSALSLIVIFPIQE